MLSIRLFAWLATLVVTSALWGGAPQVVRAQDQDGPFPVHIEVPHVLIDAPVESIKVENGIMSPPTGLWNAGAVNGGSRLDQPGFNLFYGFAQFTGTPFGAFLYLQESAPGQTISVTGSDGAVYDFEIASSEIVEPDQALGSIEDAPEDAESWIVLLSWARYDASLGTSPGYTMVKAARTSDPPRFAEQVVAEQTEPPVSCIELPNLPPQAWYAGIAQMEVSSAELADLALIQELELPLDSVLPSCDVEIESAIQLWDGNVLALVGPTSSVSATDLENAVVYETIPEVSNYDRTVMFQFVLFINQGGTWVVNLGPIS